MRPDPDVVVQPVVLCGGSGSRLWPLSRAGFPKQFLCLTGDESLFQQAVRRIAESCRGDFEARPPLLVTGEEHRFLASEQLRETGLAHGSLLLEPVGRGTAPAVTLAALAAMEKDQDPVLVITPADQAIADEAAFAAAVQIAIGQASLGNIVILGIAPDSPETGFGYIRVDADAQPPVMGVQGFVEKPDVVTAQACLDAGGHYWNAGIFFFKASIWLAALEHFRPDILSATRSAWACRHADSRMSCQFVRPGKAEFSAIPADSVDFAVLEKCSASHFPIQMVPLHSPWSDLGAWDAVWKMLPKDANGNAHVGDVIATNTRNTLVHAQSRLVGLVGVENLIVVETADAVLISDMSRNQDVKVIVRELTGKGRTEPDIHRKAYRPWGWYDCIDEGPRFKVKRIQVKPGACLSLQMHHHRAEHWVVVTGIAEVTCGDKVVLLSENQSTFIPLGENHRLRNPGSILLEIIEVQSGTYLGEDDIQRFDDSYGRAGDE